MSVEKAAVGDASAIHSLISECAENGKILPRALGEIYRNIRDFFVCREDGKVVACGALQVVWDGMAEIRSVAVRPQKRGTGLGTSIVNACIEEAKTLGVQSVFVLTYETPFFAAFGFEHIDKSALPHKIWSDCIDCPKFPDCDEEAMIIRLT